jgi:hypothetical protein
MVKRYLPSIEALSSSDDALLAEELRLSEVCAELAVARAFLDQMERMVSCRMGDRAANDADPGVAPRAYG